MKKNFGKTAKRTVCLLLTAVILLSCSLFTSAKREENPLQNYDSMTIVGTDDMTLVFHKIWGGEVRVPVESVYMNERNGEKVALFITNDRSLYDFEAQVTEVKESGSAETKYRFTVGRLTSSNAIPMTPFMEACNVAFIYMAMIIDYDPVSAPMPLSGYAGTVTKDNIDYIVGFVSQLFNADNAPEGSERVDEQGRIYYNWGVYSAFSNIKVFFDVTLDDIKQSSYYDEAQNGPGYIRVYPCPKNTDYMNLKISVKHDADADIWNCRETYLNKDGSSSSFTLAFNDDAIVTKLIPDPHRYPAGDTDGDGSTDITDAMMLFYYVAKKTDLTDEQLGRSHSNSDYGIDIEDAMALFYYVAKKTDRFFSPTES